jgi:hypothetical protein
MKYPNVFIDTSAYKGSRYPKELVDYMRGNARHRILFGSNHPFWPAGECIAGLDARDLGQPAKAAFLAGNARLYSSSTKSAAWALARAGRSRSVKECHHALDDRAQTRPRRRRDHEYK